jgi:phage virion morphogenesis protein
MAGARITIEVDDRQVLRVLDQMLAQMEDITPALGDIGEALLNSTRRRFDDQRAPDGTPWAPLTETTRNLKPRNKDKILVLTNYLRGNLRYRTEPDGLELGTDRIYGAMHQFGGVTAPNSMIPGKTIPARPFLGLSDDDRTEVLAILSKHFEKAWG